MLTKLRKLMQENNIDAYIITKFDPHQTEYADNYYNVTSFISSFTGSVATVVITKTEAHLWTDSRYFLQAEKELSEEFTLQKMGEQGTVDVLDFAAGFGTVGIDFATYPAESGKKLARKIKMKQGVLVDIDLISLIWKEREFAKREGIFLYDEKFTGESFENKLSLVRSQMKTPYYIISSLDDIAWFLNIRSLGEFNTFNFLAYILIEPENVILFIDKVDKDIFPEGIQIKPYSEVFNYIKGKETSVAPTRTNYKIYQTLEKKMVLIHDITTTLKSKKNAIEIENIKKANIKDAVVHIKFYKWLKENGAGKTEYEIGKKLYEMRIEAGAKNHSFPPIVGYLENGAIVHYRASDNSSKTVQNKGFLLVDSGANYIEGTTDITRTISMGSLSEKEKDHYTLVLKAHIALDTQKFPQGTSGMALDVVTRIPLWDALLNFGHGTGHGIGHFLNVHEGPCTIAPKGFEPLDIGNVLSNEPGLYITGEYGIRLENAILVTLAEKNLGLQFFKFETLTFLPFEREAINKKLLTEEELNWLNNYHENTYKILEEHLAAEEKNWLKGATEKI